VNTRPKGEITLLRAKRKSGEALTEEEKAKLRDYYRLDGRRKRGIHLKGGREEQWTLLAEKQGVSFSAWVQERVEEALQGSSEVEKELRREAQRLRDEVSALRGTSGHLAVENSRLQARIEAMEGSLMEAMDQALRLSGVRA
jgi:hypothetical protein